MSSVLTRPSPPPSRTVSYGPHPDQVYDVREPRAERSPQPVGTVIVVHGGFWRPDIDRTHSGPHAQALADLGHHVVVLEYRRTPGDWEAMAADLRDGVAAVRNAADDPDRVALVGHSAGGHLVIWAAHQTWTSGIRAAVSLAGCVDLALVDELRLDRDAAQALMGTPRQADLQRWTAADPALLGEPVCSVELVHGEGDDRVPLQVSRSYAARTGLTVHELTGTGHFELIDPLTEQWRVGARLASEALHRPA